MPDEDAPLYDVARDDAPRRRRSAAGGLGTGLRRSGGWGSGVRFGRGGGKFSWREAGRYAGLTACVFVIALLSATIVAAIVQRRNPVDVWANLFVDSPQKVFGKDRLTLLLLGIDYNYDNKDQPFSAGARSDTIIAVALNFPNASNPRGSVHLLSVPRDMDAIMPSGREDKINAVYSLGKDPLDSAHRSEAVVAQFLGLRGFDRFVTLRINAAKELVDAIGGVDVVPDETMDYDDTWGHLHIHFKGGKKYHMNGEQAVSYSRFRHDACGDPCRIKRQQQVLRIVLNKLSSDKLNDLLHINQLIGVVRRNVITDVSDKEALVIANAMRNVDLKKLKAEQIPYIGDKDLVCCGNVIVADEQAKKDLVRKLFLSPVSTPDRGAVMAVAPSSIRVDVRNGSGVPGVARRMAAALRKQGFVVTNVGDAGHRGYQTTEVHPHTAIAYAGDRVLGALGLKSAVLVPDAAVTGGASDVTLIVGADWNGPDREASAVK